MGAVAVRRIHGTFAFAQRCAFALFGYEFQWHEIRTLMRAIAKGLVSRLATAAPEIGFGFLEFGDRGLAHCYFFRIRNLFVSFRRGVDWSEAVTVTKIAAKT
jgi:hypothetical protein